MDQRDGNAVHGSGLNVDMDDWVERVTLKDSHHMEKSEKNQHETMVQICCTMYLLSMSNRSSYTEAWKAKLKALIRQGRRDKGALETNPHRKQVPGTELFEELRSRIIATKRTPLAQQRPDEKFSQEELRRGSRPTLQLRSCPKHRSPASVGGFPNMQHRNLLQCFDCAGLRRRDHCVAVWCLPNRGQKPAENQTRLGDVRELAHLAERHATLWSLA